MSKFDYMIADMIVGDKKKSVKRAKKMYQWCKKNKRYVKKQKGRW